VVAKRHQYAIAREDLIGLIESLRKLPKSHKVGLLILSQEASTMGRSAIRETRSTRSYSEA